MIADQLQPGDTFVCHSQSEWDAMSASERKQSRRATLDRRLGTCISYGQIHLRTSAGTWCIAKVAPVVVLGVEKRDKKPAVKPGKKFIPAPTVIVKVNVSAGDA